MFSKLFDRGAAAGAVIEAAPAAPAIDWAQRLQAAAGDVPQLLALVHEAVGHEIRLQVVSALAENETALRQLESEFRNHDKRIYRAAHEALAHLEQRKTHRLRADALLQRARALLSEAWWPANRLVELDHDWQSLNMELLAESQSTEFCTLRAQLTERLGHFAAAQREQQQHLDALVVAGQALQAVCDAPGPMSPEAISVATQSVQHARSALVVAKSAAISATVGEFVAELERLLSRAEQAVAQTVAHQAQQVAEDQRKALQQAQEHQRQQTARQRIQIEKVCQTHLQAAQTALEEGHPQQADEHLAAYRMACATAGSMPGGAFERRFQQLQAEHTRLKGWQQWGGGQARAALLQEAEALAALVPCLDTAALLKTHTEAIDGLRLRWRALEQPGQPAPQGVWKRFDAALRRAWQPVAVQQQKLKEMRALHLAQRQALLEPLEACVLPQSVDDVAGWQQLAAVLESFKEAWRKLGPPQHNVPRAALSALLARQAAAVERLDVPLKAARAQAGAAAQARRQGLVDAARALMGEAARRDLPAKVRALQGAWREAVQQQPLPRKLEQRLWADFKAAIDALFVVREQAKVAHEAQQQASQSARASVIAGLDALSATLDPETLARRIAEGMAQWRQLDAPRERGDRLETAFRQAHERAQKCLLESRHNQWQIAADELAARLMLCDAVESQATDGEHDAARIRWSALTEARLLPLVWRQALQQRFAAALQPDGREQGYAGALDDKLLRLEAAFNLPSPADCESARRELKLQAMKQALENRQPQAATDGLALIAAALALPCASVGQRQRLQAILAAWPAQQARQQVRR
jgi:exonuclease SbcC